MTEQVGICGLGFVGGAMMKSFMMKGYILNDNLFVYDKYKEGGIGKFEDLLKTDILFLALPTPYDPIKHCYDVQPLVDTVTKLKESKYKGAVVIKSTVEPTTTERLSESLNIIHNPEFLTARTAFEDFHNQKHIVLGKSSNCSNTAYKTVINFYKHIFPEAEISESSANESESMKLFVNCFYATKVQFFNELYLFSNKIGADYDTIKKLMLKNGWINPMHTDVPGPDGKLSYGGMCFPKDTNALLSQMEEYDSPHKVLSAVVEERDMMRTDKFF
jgi:UDPglucose 6-dehydrogenase